MTTEELTALAALLAKMTPGTWIAAPYSGTVGAPIVASPSGRPIAKVIYFNLGPEFAAHGRESAANAAGIVALVNAAPALLASAARAAELEAEVSRLRSAIDWQAAAVRTLHANEETEINRLRKQQQQWHQAVASLDSEREANAMLTAEVERLQRILTALGAA